MVVGLYSRRVARLRELAALRRKAAKELRTRASRLALAVNKSAAKVKSARAAHAKAVEAAAAAKAKAEQEAAAAPASPGLLPSPPGGELPGAGSGVLPFGMSGTILSLPSLDPNGAMLPDPLASMDLNDLTLPPANLLDVCNAPGAWHAAEADNLAF